MKGKNMLRESFAAYIKELEAEVTAMGQMVITATQSFDGCAENPKYRRGKKNRCR